MSFIDKLENVMHNAVDNCEVAGASLLVEKDGTELCYCEAGISDLPLSNVTEWILWLVPKTGGRGNHRLIDSAKVDRIIHKIFEIFVKINYHLITSQL